MKRGYSIVELVVVVGVVAGILAMIAGIMINTFKANNKTIMMQAVDENGSWAIEKIRQFVLSTSGSTIECTSDGQVRVKCPGDDCDGKGIYCKGVSFDTGDGVIRNETENLTKQNEVLVNCDTFGVKCDEADGVVTGVGLSFYMYTGETSSPSNFVGKTFNTKITLRN